MGGDVGIWVAKLVTRLVLGKLSRYEFRYLSKIQNGRHKQKEWPTLPRQIKLNKNFARMAAIFEGCAIYGN
jgi:hypothetical protein